MVFAITGRSVKRIIRHRHRLFYSKPVAGVSAKAVARCRCHCRDSLAVDVVAGAMPCVADVVAANLGSKPQQFALRHFNASAEPVLIDPKMSPKTHPKPPAHRCAFF